MPLKPLETHFCHLSISVLDTDGGGSISYLIAFFEAKPKVDEFKTFILCAPQYVTGFEVCVDITLVVEKSKGLQNVSGTVLYHPHGTTLVTGV